MDDKLPALLRAEIVRRFSEHGPALGEGDRIATFKCPSGAIGDVAIDVDGPGVVVEISGMTHGHFDRGSSEEVVDACATFLTDLFDDEVVVWVSANGGSVRMVLPLIQRRPAPWFTRGDLVRIVG